MRLAPSICADSSKRGIDRFEGAVGEKIGEGEDMDADHEDHARHTEDVEGPRLASRRARLQQAIELPGIGPEQDDVGKRRQVGRRDVGERHQRVHDRRSGMSLRAVAQASGTPMQHAHDAGAERQFKGVDKGREILRSREGALQDAQARIHCGRPKAPSTSHSNG